MKKSNSLLASFVVVIILALGAMGCGGMIDPTVKVNYTVDTSDIASALANLPMPPTVPPQPAPPAPPPTTNPPPSTTGGTVAPNVVVTNIVIDHNNPFSPLADTWSAQLVWYYRLHAGDAGTAARKLVVNTDKTLPWMQGMFFNPRTWQVIYVTVPGPATRFEFVNSNGLELGFCPLAGDEVWMQLTTDATKLDGVDVHVEIERVTVSVGQGATQDILSNLPPAITVRYREHARLLHTPVLAQRVDARSSDMEAAVVGLSNTSSVHTNTVTEINWFNPTIPAGVSNLRLEIKGNTFPLTQTPGMLYANTGSVLATLSPGEKTSYRVLADTIAAVTTHLQFTANSVTVVVDHGNEDITVYADGPRVNGWDLVTFSVDIDEQVTASLLPLAQTTGQFNGREVIRCNLNALADVNMTGAAYTLASTDNTLVGEFHLVLNGVDRGGNQAPVNTLVDNAFVMQAFLLADGTSSLFEMPLYLNGGNAGDSVQLTLHAVFDDLGRAHMQRLLGQSHLIQ